MSDLGSRAWQMVKETRFLAHDPEELWAMVDPADGATATDLGDLLTEAAKTIKEIGTDLRTHSLAVEWDGEGGEAFRKWIHQAALATLGLGDYSENAGKWLGHAADTLHEVKPQLEILRKQSATARSVLDAHAAKATDVGNHDGGPTDSEVTKAKTQYANHSAEAAGQMMKLAQSYTVSTEQIDALAAPEFPELPKQFVPTQIHGGTHISAPSSGTAAGQGATTQAQASSGHKAALGTSSSGTNPAPQVAVRHHMTDPPVVPDATTRRLPDTTNTGIDSVSTLPSAPPVPWSGSAPSVSAGGVDSRTSSPTGLLPPAFGAGTTTFPPGLRGIEGRPVYGSRGPLPTPPGAGASGGSRVLGRELTGPTGPGMSGSQPVPGRGPAVPGAARSTNGITGGRPFSPTSGRSAGAIPRGTVIGGTPSEQQPPVGRGTAPAGSRIGGTPSRANGRMASPEGAAKSARLPEQSDGILGGQPKTPRQRGREGLTSGRSGLVRGTETDGAQPQRGGTARGASAVTPAPYGGDRSARDERSRNRTNQRAEDENGRPSTPDPRPEPRLPSGPDGHARREG
ncbi:hypothetical protein ACH4PR_26540 [Streptomyces mirabilis]|uniref:hypothetical protein n=1 Tax=Streptomyces mirabilis TaxID=68239 RepID=UPI0037898667